MTGPQLLIVAIIAVLVMAFLITMVVLNSQAMKTLANALELTQRRLNVLFKNHPKYANLGDYLNEKRVLLACRLLHEKPNWTIKAIGTEAGFGSRRTFQMEMKHRFGITPMQYRKGMENAVNQERTDTSD